MGTPEFATASLAALNQSAHQVVGVVTVPDKPAGRGRKLKISAVKAYALEEGLPFLQPQKLRDPAFIAALQAWRADLFAVVAFRMLPEVVWKMPPRGTVNVHASLLPDYRGAAPINRAIMAGEQVTGVSTFFINAQIDTGAVLLQESCAIGPNETAGELHDRLKEMGAQLLVRTADGLERGELQGKPQSETSTKLAPKLFPADQEIDWQRPAAQIHDQIRGLAPYPGAYTQLQREEKVVRWKILASERTGIASEDLPGVVHIREGKAIWVNTGEEYLALQILQPAGKKALNARDFLNGNKLPSGTRLGHWGVKTRD